MALSLKSFFRLKIRIESLTKLKSSNFRRRPFSANWFNFKLLILKIVKIQNFLLLFVDPSNRIRVQIRLTFNLIQFLKGFSLVEFIKAAESPQFVSSSCLSLLPNSMIIVWSTIKVVCSIWLSSLSYFNFRIYIILKSRTGLHWRHHSMKRLFLSD